MSIASTARSPHDLALTSFVATHESEERIAYCLRRRCLRKRNGQPVYRGEKFELKSCLPTIKFELRLTASTFQNRSVSFWF